MTAPRRTTAVLALAATLVALAAAPGVALAPAGTESSDQCGASQFCAWSGQLFTGSFRSTTSTTPVDTVFTVAGSVWNRTSHAARLYEGTGGTGAFVCYNPGAQFTTVSIPVRSMQVLSATSC